MTVTEDRVHIDLDVRGMTCVHCGQHVARALQSVPGVMLVDLPDWRSGQDRRSDG